MSGFYNNWFKVQNPTATNDIVPMISGGFQKPFYFGGSQVPINLNMHNTSQNINEDAYSKVNFTPHIGGKGLVKSNKKVNIHIPRHIGSMKSSF